MLTTAELTQVIALVTALPGITGARPWTTVPGRERLYLETRKCNGGKRWNGGVGFSKCYLDLNTGEVVMQGEAGAATRNWHANHGTSNAVAEAFATVRGSHAGA